MASAQSDMSEHGVQNARGNRFGSWMEEGEFDSANADSISQGPAAAEGGRGHCVNEAEVDGSGSSPHSSGQPGNPEELHPSCGTFSSQLSGFVLPHARLRNCTKVTAFSALLPRPTTKCHPLIWN